MSKIKVVGILSPDHQDYDNWELVIQFNGEEQVVGIGKGDGYILRKGAGLRFELNDSSLSMMIREIKPS